MGIVLKVVLKLEVKRTNCTDPQNTQRRGSLVRSCVDPRHSTQFLLDFLQFWDKTGVLSGPPRFPEEEGVPLGLLLSSNRECDSPTILGRRHTSIQCSLSEHMKRTQTTVEGQTV